MTRAKREARAAPCPTATRRPGVRAKRTPAAPKDAPSAAELEEALRIIATLMDAHPDLAPSLGEAFSFLDAELQRALASEQMRARAKSFSWAQDARQSGRSDPGTFSRRRATW